jgi:hypothetical protein
VGDEPIVFRRAENGAFGRDAFAEQPSLETEMRVVHGHPCPSQTLWQA